LKNYEVRTSWNNEPPKKDPLSVEYGDRCEDLIYILYKDKKIECYFETLRLVSGFLKNDNSMIERIRYHNNRPVSVKGYLPLGCLTIKGVERSNPYSVIY